MFSVNKMLGGLSNLVADSAGLGLGFIVRRGSRILRVVRRGNGLKITRIASRLSDALAFCLAFEWRGGRSIYRGSAAEFG